MSSRLQFDFETRSFTWHYFREENLEVNFEGSTVSASIFFFNHGRRHKIKKQNSYNPCLTKQPNKVIQKRDHIQAYMHLGPVTFQDRRRG